MFRIGSYSNKECIQVFLIPADEKRNRIDNKKIVFIWTDIMQKYKGADEDIRKAVKHLTIEELLKYIEFWMEFEMDSKSFRGRIEVSCAQKYIPMLKEETVIYESGNIDYRELLVSLLVLLRLTIMEDRPDLILDLAAKLKEVDEKTAKRFKNDITLGIYHKCKKFTSLLRNNEAFLQPV